jgi:hypothetical protein
MKDKKYFCYEIYKNLAVWSLNGKLAYNPCSFYKGYIKESDKFDLKDVWNSTEHLELKHAVENNIAIAGCQRCYDAENNGLESRRMGSKKLYEEYHEDTDIDLGGPTGLDYSIGNLYSVKRACDKVGLQAFITSEKKKIEDADALILPGVGAFGEAVVRLHAAGLFDQIYLHVQKEH